MSKKRVLIVDDSSFMRSIITRFIQGDERFELVGTARDGVEAVERAAELRPDVMTMDIEMPRKNGLEALKEIMEKCPTRVVMVSSLTEAGAVETMKALELGAVDFLPKAIEQRGKSIFDQGELLRDKIYAAATARNFAAPRTAPVKREAAASFSALDATRLRNAEIALVGVSTGGPKALHQIMPHFPKNLRVPMLIVQHMPPNFTAAMAKRLNELCPLNVEEAKDGQKLLPGHVYIAPGGMQCEVKKTALGFVFVVKPDENNSLYKPSVEVASASVHHACGGNVLAIMMTGMGNDGVNGFKKLKQSGGYVIAQNKETCVVYGMPKVVVDAGIADSVVALDEIPKALEQLLS